MANIAANKNRLIVQGSFDLISSVAGQLYRSAATSYAGRNYGLVRQYAESLSHCGLPAFAGVGKHYAGLAALGHGDCQKALLYFEQAIRLCTPCYRARVLLSIGSALGLAENDDSAYVKACIAAKGASNPIAHIQARQALAIIRAQEGQHWQAVAELESLYEMVKDRSDLLYIPGDMANSLAEELRLVGKIEQAKAVSDEALASPFASAYPEWRETARDIAALLNRRVIFFDSSCDAKGLAYADLLGALATNYHRLTIPMLEGLTRMAGERQGVQ